MLKKLIIFSLLSGVSTVSLAGIQCGDVFSSQKPQDQFLNKLLQPKTESELLHSPVEPKTTNIKYQQVKTYTLKNIHISHAVYYPEGQLMLIEIVHQGKKPMKTWRGHNLEDRDIALVDLRTGKLIQMPHTFDSMDDLDLATFENFGIVQPRLNEKGKLRYQLSSFHSTQMKDKTTPLTQLPYHIAFAGPYSPERSVLRGSPFPARDQLIFEDSYILLPETNSIDLSELKLIYSAAETRSQFHAILGDFDHSNPDRAYAASKVRPLEKSQNLFLYPREENILNYTFNSKFFAGMVNDDGMKVRIWSKSTGKILKDLSLESFPHLELEDKISFHSSSMGRWLVLSSEHTVIILDGESFEIKFVRHTPSSFLNTFVFSDSENSFAFQDKYHVFVWHHTSSSPQQEGPLNSRLDLFSTQGVAQRIVLPADNLVLLHPILPAPSPNSANTLNALRDQLNSSMDFVQTENRWHLYSSNTKNILLDEITPSSAGLKPLVLPVGFPTSANASGNNIFFSYTNQTDGLVPSVSIKVWRKTIEH